ncbi:MAG: Piwi domain-containing protein [Bacteroidia bacterium]
MIVPQIILTSKKGFIEELSLYKYEFVQSLISNNERFNKLTYWLTKNDKLQIYSIDSSCFYSFTEVREQPDSFKFVSKQNLKAPFNTPQISNYISFLLRTLLSKKYSQFLNKNIFIIDTVPLELFHLHKCIEFNVEAFDTGDFFIHFSPLSKIVSSKIINEPSYFSGLKIANRAQSKIDDMIFSIVNTKLFYRRKIDLLDTKYGEVVKSLFEDKDEYIATFDYHFMANFNPQIFGKITEHTLKDLRSIVKFMDPILKEIVLPDFLNLTMDNYMKSDAVEIGSNKNLLVGTIASEIITIHSKSNTQFGLRVEYTRDSIAKDELIAIFLKNEKLIEKLNNLNSPITLRAFVEQQEGWGKPYIKQIFGENDLLNFNTNTQSASFYNGIYKPVNNKYILPLILDNLNINLFHELISKFNKNSINFKILDPIIINKDMNFNESELSSVLGKNKGNSLIAVFTKYKMPLDYFLPLKGFKYQIYQGTLDDNERDRPKVSNFACKCLEKLGGVIAVIGNTSLGKGGYFIGIDLGHSTIGKDKFSNLAMALFDNHGILIGKTLVEKLPRKENLNIESCELAFKNLDQIVTKKKLAKPDHVIIHRDGKLHSNDIAIIKDSINKIWPGIILDVVEIIKSGYPLMILKLEQNEIANPVSGTSFQDNKKKYGILVTNAQADERDLTLNPIIIKHKTGNMPFNEIVEQVYWLTKIYTNNLYNSTRLPATTLLANNIVSTSSKIHRASYLG